MVDNFEEMVESLGSEVDSDVIIAKGKNSRSAIVAYGIRFDSKEELDVYEWLVECKNMGFVETFEYQPKRFELYEGSKNAKGKYMIRPHVYTADFHVKFTDKWVEFRKANKFKIFDKFDEKDIYIDVKGFQSIYDDGRQFVLNLKWMFSKYGIYIWKIIPFKLFEKTWLPQNCVLTRKTKKISAKYAKYKTFGNHNFVKVP